MNLQGLKGKHAYIEEQLFWRRSRIVFLQETKDADGMIVSKKSRRMASPANAHWGTATWVNAVEGAFDLDGKPVLVDDNDVTVLASQPRLLVLQIVKAGLRVILFSAHIPHETRERERKEVLAILDGILQRSAG